MFIEEFKTILAPPRNTVLCHPHEGIVFLRDSAKEHCQETDITVYGHQEAALFRDGLTAILYMFLDPELLLDCFLSVLNGCFVLQITSKTSATAVNSGKISIDGNSGITPSWSVFPSQNPLAEKREFASEPPTAYPPSLACTRGDG
jgi:hypothetical protein